MKKFLFSALLALSTLSSSQAANLYSSNLGNGVSLVDATTGISAGTVRFGVFPDGFDFNANVSDYSALDAAFIQVASSNDPLTVAATNGFYQKALSYDTSISYEGVPYATGIAGKKVYIWILNSTDPEEVTQQLIVSSNQTWVAADAVVADTVASPDTGVSGLTFHVGSAGGADIGAGAASHTLGGAQTAITQVTLTVAPGTTVNAGGSVTFTAVSDGSPIKSYKWRKNGVLIPAAPVSSNTFTIPASVAQDTGVYDVLVSNNLAEDIASNTLALTVNTPKPTFLTQPVSTVVAVGGTLELDASAVAAGTIQYQWKKGASITGATSAELTLPNMSLAQAGAYTLTVTNAPGAGTGTVTSAKAEVAVVDRAPASVVSATGAKVSLGTVTAGKLEGYQWFKVGTAEPLANGAKFTGVTTKALGVLSVQAADSGEYFCRITVGETNVNSGARFLKVFTAAPELNEPALLLIPSAEIGTTYSFQIPVLGDASQAPLAYAAKGLPAGLKVDAKTGLITGRPTKVAANIAVTFTVTNKVGTDTANATMSVLASPELTGLAGSYAGAIDRAPGSSIVGAELGGRFELTLTTLGALTGKVYVGAELIAVKGVIELDGALPSATLIAVRKGGLTPLNIEFEINGSAITGSISNTVSEVGFSGFRNVYSKTLSPATDYVGLYNFGIGFAEGNVNLGDDTIPQGAGYGSFTVAPDGKLTIKGKTADGEAYTTASFIGPDGQAFLFQTLYKTVAKGSIHGRLTIAEVGKVITGTATQSRPFDSSVKQRTYAAGFSVTSPASAFVIVGGAYTAPVAPLVLLNKAANTVVELTFEEGAAGAEAAEADITLLAANKLTIGTNTAKTKLVVNAKTGLITGSFALADKRAGKFEGVVIPDGSQLIGIGSFILPEATPSITTSKILSGLMSLDVPAPDVD